MSEREIKKTNSFTIASERILRNKFKQEGERLVHKNYAVNKEFLLLFYLQLCN